jgi:hypothetical protein
MEARGLVEFNLSAHDRRSTEVKLTIDGWRAIVRAAPGHIDLVRRLCFGGLPKDLLAPLKEALEEIYEHIVQHGTLPAPAVPSVTEKATVAGDGGCAWSEIGKIDRRLSRPSSLEALQPQCWDSCRDKAVLEKLFAKNPA